jgi:hypothetical protein
MKNTWLMLPGWILMVVLAVLLGRAMMPVTPALTHDTATYLNTAMNLASTGRLQMDMTLTTDQQATRRFCAYMPGYPMFLSGLFLLGIPEEAALYGLSLAGLILMSLLGSAIVWQLSRSLLGTIFTGASLLIFQPLLNTLTYALTETLYIPATLGLILAVVFYVRARRPRRIVWVVLALLMMAVTMLRLVGGMLVAIVGGVLVVRSLISKDWRRAAGEFALTAVSQIPAFIVLGVNYQETGRFYCATNSAGWNIERTTTGYLARLLFDQFKPDLSLGLGFRSLAEGMPTWVLLLATMIILLIGAVILWSIRKQLWQAGRDLFHWPVLVITLYVVFYLGFFFVLGNSWARWDFPRYFVPSYPFIFILLGVALTALFRRLKSWPLRVLLALGLVAILVAYTQVSLSAVANAQAGRGIETAEVRDHPVMDYVRRYLRDSDLLFTTRESTLWYYFRRPVRRVQFLDQTTCQQLPLPMAGGRTMFILFPDGNYFADPVSAENETWFRNWISACGTVVDHQILKDAAVYLVEPLPNP